MRDEENILLSWLSFGDSYNDSTLVAGILHERKLPFFIFYFIFCMQLLEVFIT